MHILVRMIFSLGIGKKGNVIYYIRINMNCSMLLKSAKIDDHHSASKFNRYERSNSLRSNKISAKKRNAANMS